MPSIVFLRPCNQQISTQRTLVTYYTLSRKWNQIIEIGVNILSRIEIFLLMMTVPMPIRMRLAAGADITCKYSVRLRYLPLRYLARSCIQRSLILLYSNLPPYALHRKLMNQYLLTSLTNSTSINFCSLSQSSGWDVDYTYTRNSI